MERDVFIATFRFLFFFRWRAFKAHNFEFTILSLEFFLFFFRCCFGLMQFVPTCLSCQISDGTPFSHLITDNDLA